MQLANFDNLQRNNNLQQGTCYETLITCKEYAQQLGQRPGVQAGHGGGRQHQR